MFRIDKIFFQEFVSNTWYLLSVNWWITWNTCNRNGTFNVVCNPSHLHFDDFNEKFSYEKNQPVIFFVLFPYDLFLLGCSIFQTSFISLQYSFFFSQEQNLEDSTTPVQNCDPVASLIYNSIKCVGLVISVTNVVQYIPIIPNITEKPKYLISLSLLFYLISPLER